MLRCTSLVLRYQLHLGENAGNVGSASSGVTLPASRWASPLPHPVGLLGLEHQGSNWQAALPVWQQACPSPDHVILIVQPLPPGAAPATVISPLKVTDLAVGEQQAAWVCSGPGSVEFTTDLVCPLPSGCTSESLLPKITELQALRCLVSFLWDLWFGCQ